AAPPDLHPFLHERSSDLDPRQRQTILATELLPHGRKNLALELLLEPRNRSPAFGLRRFCCGFSHLSQLSRLAASRVVPDPGEFRSEEHTSELQSRGNLVC